MGSSGKENGDDPGHASLRYERMLNAMREAACIYDEEGRFELVNEFLADFYDSAPEELEGKQSTLIPQIRAQREGDPFEELWAGEREEIHGEIAGEYPGRGRAVLEYRLTPLVIDGDVDGVVGVARDVRERKRHERQLRRQNERLDQFASVVSHDLRNPLNVATGHLELAAEECDSDHIEAVADAHDRIETLIDDLLTLAREGKSVGETEPVELAVLARACWDSVDTGGASLAVETERTVEADRPRLRQLLENLIRNAVDHGGTDPTVTVGDCEGGFYVADDGPGLDHADRERLFEVGYSTTDEGTGFGLGIVDSIVDGHGWEITATESAAGGARFEIIGVDVVA